MCSEGHSSHFNVFGRNGSPSVVIKAREIVCRLEGFQASSLVTPALTVAPLEPGSGEAVCSLISYGGNLSHFCKIYIKRVHFISYVILPGVCA